MIPYKFSKCAAETKPDTETTRLLEKAQRKEPLTREEKDRIADILWGTFGSHSSTYKLAGWAWYMGDCLPRILVNYKHDNGQFNTYHAPDKTSLRQALITPIREMVYA